MEKIMENFVNKSKNLIGSIDFVIGSIFLLFIILMFVLEASSLELIQIFFGFVFILSLGGFFMYIFTPSLVEFCRSMLYDEKRRLLPPICVLFLFTIYRIILPTSTNWVTVVTQVVSAFVFVLVPSILYIMFPPSSESGLSWIDVIGGLWVWLPIEFGLVDDFIGSVEIGGLPFDTLLALFAFIYALIFIRNHDMGTTFTISLDDFFLVGFVTGILTVTILPFGILTYFLAPPDIIVDNFLQLLQKLPGSLLTIILTFISIFLTIALIEEIFFRGFIYKLLRIKFESSSASRNWWYGGLIGLMGLIVISPWVDDILLVVSQISSVFSPLHDIVVSNPLAEPLGDAEGQAWPLVQSVSLEVLYLIVAIILGIIAFIIMYKTEDPVIAALILSSILFGWAHFEDPRYIFSASIAGFGYGWTYQKTGKIVPAALVHMAVDAVWSLLFTL